MILTFPFFSSPLRKNRRRFLNKVNIERSRPVESAMAIMRNRYERFYRIIAVDLCGREAPETKIKKFMTET